MTPKEKILYLLKHYYMGNYNTKIFVDEFMDVYYLELDKKSLTIKEKILLNDLEDVIERFSPYEEDLKLSKFFCSEKEVKDKATEVYLNLIEN